jgi:hypothetical protein
MGKWNAEAQHRRIDRVLEDQEEVREMGRALEPDVGRSTDPEASEETRAENIQKVQDLLRSPEQNAKKQGECHRSDVLPKVHRGQLLTLGV